MNRQPVYNAKDPNYRIVSVPNGLWQFQHKSCEGGSREKDNWTLLARPTDRDTALGQMAGRV